MIRKYIIIFFFIAAAPWAVVNGQITSPKEQSRSVWSVSADAVPKPRIALVLSGGGARGMAQIGVLQEMERAGIQPDYVIGTSIGAVVGGLWSAGYTSNQMDSIVRAVPWGEVFSLGNERVRGDLFLDQKYEQDRSLLTLRFKDFGFVIPQSFSGGVRFTALLQRLLWNGIYHDNGNFNNLRVPFRAVATDIVRGTSVSLKEGNLVTAIRASATLPLRYTPVRIDSMVLVDGGLFANIPVEATKEFHPDMVVAINTTSPLLPPTALDKPWNVADQVVSVMMQHFKKQSQTQATFLIEPSIGIHENTDFNGLDSLIRLGRSAWEQQSKQVVDAYNRAYDSIITEQFFAERTIFSSGTSVTLTTNNILPKHSSGITTNAHYTKAELVRVIRELIQSGDYKQLTLSYDNAAQSLMLSAEVNPVLSEIRVLGYSVPDSIVRPFIGTRYSVASVRTITEHILRFSRQHGESFVDVRLVGLDKEKNILTITLDSGTVRVIEIAGNKQATNLFISRELEFEIGDAPTAERIVQGWENILNTELFSEVGIEVRQLSHENSGIGIKINVEEVGSQIIRLGGRIDNERNTQLTADFIHENVLSSGIRAGLRIGGGGRNSIGILRFDVPRILNSYWTGAIRAFWNSRTIRVYENVGGLPRTEYERVQTAEQNEQHAGFKALFGRQIETSGRVGVELRYEVQRIFTLGNFTTSRAFLPLTSITLSTLFDTENRADFPTQGRILSISLEKTILEQPNGIGFAKAEFKVSNTFTLGAHTIRPVFQFGFADATLPVPEFFNFGGQDVFFGLREEEERGRQLALAQLEYRVKSPINILFETYFSVRYDLGRVWQEMESIKLSSLRHGIGATIAWDTPLGPAKFSVGRSFYFITNPNSAVFGPYLLYFGIGTRIQ
ncbi:MAG: patatin-like phospholipase family protein [Bacteriodetes bacterium]|nr:patatin-like phospholipase family protein [Bacteroidota bacterium]